MPIFSINLAFEICRAVYYDFPSLSPILMSTSISKSVIHFYALGISLTMLFLLASCSSRRAVDKKVHAETHHEIVSDVKHSLSNLRGLRREIVKEALSWEGTPYKYASADKVEGTDCSGMVLRVYETVAQVKLPRNSGKQSEFCENIRMKDLLPGDLVFFATGKDPSRVSHVGVMLDESHFIHASTSKGVVISDITTPYYQRTFICCGRVPGI